MDLQDYSDGSDESDLDYKPPGEVENVSEIDSDDPIEDDDYVANTSARKSKKTPKRKTKGKRSSQKKFKKLETDNEVIEKIKEEDNILLQSTEEDKKRLDSLWEEFQRPIVKKSMSNTPNTSQNKSKLKETTKISDKLEITKKRNFEDIFNTVDSSKKEESNDHKSVPISSTAPTVKKLSGGISNILSQIGKKNKLTVLEKSKLDWDGYKQKEGIVEELITYNKGKDGYLEKRDFLERTDLRQFELEKAMRDANRSRRN